MSFRDNLLHLRASRNMTQEQLAVQLGVSRQSVTKWESERSYPEMDKLIKLCQLFDCTLDELVQGDLTGRASAPASAVAPNARPADVFGYDEIMRRFASRISGGVMAIILGVALLTMIFGISDAIVGDGAASLRNLLGAAALLCLFAGIVVGLWLIVPASMAHSQFVREHPYIEDFYTTEQKARARTAFSYECIGGIAAILCGIIVVVVLGDTRYEEAAGVPAMLALIAVGVRFIIHGAMTLSRTNVAEYNRGAAEVLESYEIAAADIPPERKQELLDAHAVEKRVGAVCGAIMMVATIVALLLLFGSVATGLDDYSHGLISLFWLPWPIGGLLCGVVALLMKGFGIGVSKA